MPTEIGPLEIVILTMVFGASVMIFMAIAPLFANRVDLRGRLGGQQAPALNTTSARLRPDQAGSAWARLVQGIEARGFSLDDTKSIVIRQKLALAGFHAPHATRVYVLIRIVLTFGLPALGMLVLYFSGSQMSLTNTYMVLTGLAAVGLYVPNMIISNRAATRQKLILNGFPDTLDLMLVCVEAGLGIDASFNRVGSEITKSHPLLSELLASVALELRAGRSREDALRNFTKRSAVPEIGAFVTLIIQSDKLGSSIAQALKSYAVEMREGRRMRAEEKAHRLPVLLSVPLVACMLPTMIGVLMLPAVITMKKTMGPTATQSPATK